MKVRVLTLVAALCSLSASGLCAYPTNSQGPNRSSAQEQYHIQNQRSARSYESDQVTPGEQRSSAMSLNAEEHRFAAKLSDLHRAVFMNQFTNQQRAEAMALVEVETKKRGFRSSSGLSPDEAVEIVMKNHRGVATGQGKMMKKSKSSPKRYPQSQQQYYQDHEPSRPPEVQQDHMQQSQEKQPEAQKRYNQQQKSSKPNATKKSKKTYIWE